MQVQQVIQNNNTWTQFEQGKTSLNKSSAPASKDSFISTIKKNDKLKYSMIAIGALTALIAFINRKKITEVLSNLFKKEKNIDLPAKSKTMPVEPPVVQPKPTLKYDIPEPKFTCGAENPVQFAKEKDEYVKQLINSVSLNNDEDFALRAIKEFNEHSSKTKFLRMGNETNHLKMLGSEISRMKNKSDKVLQAYLKTYVEHGKPSILDVAEIPLADSQTLKSIFDNYNDIMSKDSALLMIEGFKKTGCTLSDMLTTGNFKKELYKKRFSEADFKQISSSAQDAIDTITQRGYINSGGVIHKTDSL